MKNPILCWVFDDFPEIQRYAGHLFKTIPLYKLGLTVQAFKIICLPFEFCYQCETLIIKVCPTSSADLYVFVLSFAYYYSYFSLIGFLIR